ncbi:hypothetical protein B0H11DRAFT_269457 [Mycena galericulata]|nr:hypothetical protein B0H11DRAFT_269457 [Mycena galericulata]
MGRASTGDRPMQTPSREAPLPAHHLSGRLHLPAMGAPISQGDSIPTPYASGGLKLHCAPALFVSPASALASTRRAHPSLLSTSPFHSIAAHGTHSTVLFPPQASAAVMQTIPRQCATLPECVRVALNPIVLGGARFPRWVHPSRKATPYSRKMSGTNVHRPPPGMHSAHPESTPTPLPNAYPYSVESFPPIGRINPNGAADDGTLTNIKPLDLKSESALKVATSLLVLHLYSAYIVF